MLNPEVLFPTLMYFLFPVVFHILVLVEMVLGYPMWISYAANTFVEPNGPQFIRTDKSREKRRRD